MIRVLISALKIICGAKDLENPLMLPVLPDRFLNGLKPDLKDFDDPVGDGSPIKLSTFSKSIWGE
jgi:hypothetical protein